MPLVNSVAEATVPEKILLAAHHLEEQGQSPFSAEALVVASWQKYPRTFGLKSFEEKYPDSNKVLASIMGEKGLTRKGWLAKMGQRLYALSGEGRQALRRLQHDGEPPPERPQAVKLKKDQDKFLQHVLASTAVYKYQEGRKQELKFADACRFWDITEHLRSEVLNAQLDHVRARLADLEGVLEDNHATLGNGRSVEPSDINLLVRIHADLQKRFSHHLNLVRSRSERG